MNKIFLLMWSIGLSCAALGQTTRGSWEVLSSLQLGQNIQVIDSSSNKHAGTFMSVSETAISLRVASGERSIQKEDVRSVKLLANKRRGRNTLVGAAVGGGIGAGVGAIVGAATHKGCASEAFCLDIIGEGGSAGIGAAVGLLGGVITGGAIGALTPSHITVYAVKAH